MPLYTWQGITIHGEPCTGKTFASSYQDLEDQLLRQQIGLTQARSALTVRIPFHERQAFFTHLASLLTAHIPLYQALTICAQSANGYAQDVLLDCAHRVAQGKALSVVLSLHRLTDDISKSLIVVGEKTGTLGVVMKHYVSYLDNAAALKAKMRQTLLGPLITVSFFMVTLVIMILFVVPQFESFYKAYDLPLPGIMHVIVQLCEVLLGPFGPYIGLAFGFGLLACTASLRTKWGRSWYELIIRYLPIIGRVLHMNQQGRILRTLTMLLSQGVPLVYALQATESVLKYEVYKEAVRKIREALVNGDTFAVAWHRSILNDKEIETLITVGQSSGNLDKMMHCAAHQKERDVQQRVHLYVQVIQPLILLIVAIGIAGLIFAVYMPLLTLSSSFA